MERKLAFNPQVLRMIGHKLRTPLSIINGYCEAIQAQNKSALSPFSVKALEEIAQQGEHVSMLVDKLIVCNKVFSTTEETLTKEEINLKALIKESATTVLTWEENHHCPQGTSEEAVTRRGTFVETDCPDHLTVHANAEMLRLCVEELIDNAMKFNKKSEKVIKIQAINHGSCISLSVRDYGSGIRSQDVDQIFEPFYQVDDDLTGQVEGWGLGLTMVRRILKLHGGSISVVSDKGLGSIFTINLPL